jgi:peptide-methionine (S)-S-oxide reductase
MSTHEIITLGGGCFWCTEAVFERVRGVVSVESGYANGQVESPTYEQVCRGDTGHAEVVRITFDPEVVGLRELLEIFFVVHDPTTLNRQGADVGTQYRSAILWHEPSQVAVAQSVLREVSAALPAAVVTELAPLQCYWPAEAYHQHYFAQHPGEGYCAFVVAPKVQKFQQRFAQRLRD